MAATTRKRPKSTLVKQETVGHAIAFLQDLPEKTKEDLSLREAVEQMREPIRAALAKGYSYDDVAKMLSDKGIKISALTLKNYAPSGRRQAGKTTTRRPRRSTKSAAADQSSSSNNAKGEDDSEAKSSAITTPELTETATNGVEPAPTKPRRGRRKSVAADAQPESTTRAGLTRTRKSSSEKPTASTTTRRRRRSKSE
ncbi:hypothetical protein [Leptothermofonsia sp. ETS-13]|uniref:hypothetical protein n=1 Tax=Leptothermofonsia sp. ETS-13 TaxID=3035696 RepID=UPI003BA2635A